MNNDLTKPCSGCPFRKDGKGVKLGAERIKDLAAGISKGHGFACHKTVNYQDEGDGEERTYSSGEQLCAGALAFGLNTGDEITDRVVQIRLHCNAGKIAKIREAQKDVYSSTEEWVKNGSC